MTVAINFSHGSERRRIQDAIFSRLRNQQRQALRSPGGPVILRADVPVQGIHALTWLCAQHPTSRGYWSDRENRFELAGTGGADVITGDSGIDYHELMTLLHRRLASAQGEPRYFGGLRFSLNGRQEKTWRCFKAYRFILPRFEVLTRHGRTTFACNMLSNENMEEIQCAFASLAFPDGCAAAKIPSPISRKDHPDRVQWCAAVETALKAFESDVYEKVVLARKVSLAFREDLDAAAVLKALKENTPQCFHFLFQPHVSAGFLGASPERLYRRDANVIRTEAVAGSRPRGTSLEEDGRLSKALEGSDKDLREHRYVVEAIHEALKTFCRLLTVEEKPRLLRLRRCQHLITGFQGKLTEGVRDADLLHTLHPTPAVGGVPKKRALEDIARLEPFDRGWYAGPVGWIAKDAAQFVVGIRSGLAEGKKLHLYSGAGIVKGSVPEEEWDEIETKISDFLALFASHENTAGQLE